MSANVAKLEEHLTTRSYVEGWVADQLETIARGLWRFFGFHWNRITNEVNGGLTYYFLNVDIFLRKPM